MPHSHTYDAIVLRCIDVGEADRFCILFTRERGRIAVRAPGARRLLSRKGGALLAQQRVTVEVKEAGSGMYAVSASRSSAPTPVPSPDGGGEKGEGDLYETYGFPVASEGIQLLLALIPDEEPLPDVFDTLAEFLERCRRESSQALLVAFVFRLLHLLGHLPEGSSPFFSAMSALEQEALATARGPSWAHMPGPPLARFASLQRSLLEDLVALPFRGQHLPVL